MPSVNQYLGKVVRDITASGSIAFEEGRKLITSAMDDADHTLNNIASGNESAIKTQEIGTETSKSIS
jgi:hypothetical protein